MNDAKEVIKRFKRKKNKTESAENPNKSLTHCKDNHTNN